ncbi:MAG: hypothetical protein GFH27_549289n327 [Chloroflexi bacterium AL-W]|nr:hypothetical protein [Chloroflexi bacterium AL-N1]NOK67059.1 hypothetical protein [Chloroflexi bacterium AL-N10]NOK74649.1 hypothetical protein [Chloroflexi bacterium AL-N5]NOK81661.1 hypothetical protein [Chloroflexi bacterium AL-W]NOK89131.1 hypothetical protein [Chloroflexi bacterium AL-N15]
MRIINKVFGLFIATMVFVATGISVSAQSSVSQEYMELYEKYDLISVSEVPDGIVPIVIESPEQLQKLLQNIGVQNNVIERQPFLPDIPTTDAQTIVQRQCTANAGLATFNTWADIVVDFVPGSSFRAINSANAWVGLTGVTLGFDLTSTYTNVYNRTSSIEIVGGGIIDVYLVIDGGIKIYSNPISCTINYALY